MQSCAVVCFTVVFVLSLCQKKVSQIFPVSLLCPAGAAGCRLPVCRGLACRINSPQTSPNVAPALTVPLRFLRSCRRVCPSAQASGCHPRRSLPKGGPPLPPAGAEPTPLRARSRLCCSLRRGALGPRLRSHLQLQQRRRELQRGDGPVRLRGRLHGRPLPRE